VEVLVVVAPSGGGSGGGGGGGIELQPNSKSGTVITVTVGDGGAGKTGLTNGDQGSNSSISGAGLTTITSWWRRWWFLSRWSK
jgi:hypothetical protein